MYTYIVSANGLEDAQSIICGLRQWRISIDSAHTEQLEIDVVGREEYCEGIL